MFRQAAGLCIAATLSIFAAMAGAQTLGSHFTYQGELWGDGAPANGLYDMRLRLYDTATVGLQSGSTLCADDVAVTNGRFVTILDFGAAFTGQRGFMEIEVRTDSGLGCSNASGFTVLSPRQELTVVPNAAFATGAGSASNAAALNGQASVLLPQRGEPDRLVAREPSERNLHKLAEPEQREQHDCRKRLRADATQRSKHLHGHTRPGSIADELAGWRRPDGKFSLADDRGVGRDGLEDPRCELVQVDGDSVSSDGDRSAHHARVGRQLPRSDHGACPPRRDYLHRGVLGLCPHARASQRRLGGRVGLEQ